MTKRNAVVLAVIAAAAAVLTMALLRDDGGSGWSKDAQDSFVQSCVNQGATEEQCRCSLGVAEDLYDTQSKMNEVSAQAQKTGQMPAEYVDAIRSECS